MQQAPGWPQQRQRKASMVEEFMKEQVRLTKKSKASTRLELARAENKKEKAYNNMLKAKARAAQAMEKFRENEATYEVASEEVARLQKLVDEEGDMDISLL